jgi:hypothetical protein
LDAIDILNMKNRISIYTYPSLANENHSENHIFERDIVYKFEKSGFFSTIFTLINISFYCKFHSINLEIDWSNWQYPINIKFLFPSLIAQSSISTSYTGHDILFYESRIFIDQLSYTDRISYNKFKKLIITSIFDWCTHNLDIKELNKINEVKKSTVCFIRRGDKLYKESYPLTIQDYSSNLSFFNNITICGDDYLFNKRLSLKHAAFNYTPFNNKPNGAKLKDNSLLSTFTILSNFYLLCICENLIGDPYCNLVSAALIYRDEHTSYCKQLFPWKLRDYV